MKYFVDTNIFLRVIVRGDEKSYLECSQFLKFIEENKIEAISSTLVLSEVAWVLGSFYNYTRLGVAEATQSIVNIKDIKWVDEYDYALALRNFAETSVKFIDAMIASIKQVRAKEWVVVSYDRDFDKLKVLRKEPGKVLAS